MSESPKKHRNSLNVTLYDSFEKDLSESHIFSVVFGSPNSMMGGGVLVATRQAIRVQQIIQSL